MGVISDFIIQAKFLGGSTPQTPERISFSVGCLHAAADIFASSEWVYPENSIVIPQFETDVLSTGKLNSVYALSKLMTEDFIRVNSDNLNYSILRYSPAGE